MIKINWRAIARHILTPRSGNDTAATPPKFVPPDMPSGVAPPAAMAMDSIPGLPGVYDYANLAYGGQGLCLSHESFMGYARLAMLSQKAEFRMLSEKPAEAMVRKWIEFKTKTPRAVELEKLLKHYKVRDLFEEAAKQDGMFGRAQLFVDLGEHMGDELQTPLIMDKAKLQTTAGMPKLRKFKLIEAMYTYPADYRADNPMADSYYNPQGWYVMGNKVHSSRLLLFVGRPLPDLLKPAYNFGGMSMSQLALPYVENWLRTRQAVNRMISKFSKTGIATNMMNVLTGDTGDDLLSRMQLYSQWADNEGLYVLDKDTEEMFQYNTPLTSLDLLQAQAQEHMSSVSGIPLVVLFGITPAGLNANSDGEIRVWYDRVKDSQNSFFRANLQTVMDIIQIAHFGDKEEIDWDFLPLYEQTEEEQSRIRKTDAETDDIYVNMGVVSPDEVRERISNDPNSGYTGLPPGAPELPEPEDDETTGTGKDNPAKTDKG